MDSNVKMTMNTDVLTRQEGVAALLVRLERLERLDGLGCLVQLL